LNLRSCFIIHRFFLRSSPSSTGVPFFTASEN